MERMFVFFALVLVFQGALACNTVQDCFYNGECASGHCECDHGWKGTNCTMFNFLPAPPGGDYGYHPNVTSWGGLPVLVDDTYHLIVTEIVGGCGLCTWGTNSRVIHATSKNLLGPYTYHDTALPIWSHNPHIIVDRSSNPPTFLLFHIGEADGGVTPKQCSGNGKATPKKSGIPVKKAVAASGSLHTATDINGPWTPQNPPGLGGCNNPAPYIYPNGSLYLFCSQGGNNIYIADHWKGPWKQLSANLAGDPGKGIWEDPFVFKDKRGIFKMLAHVYMGGGTSPHYWDRISGFAYSHDGITWIRQPWQPYDNYVQHTNGTTIMYTTRERPKVFFDPRDNVTPLALFTGVARGTNCWDCKLQCGVDWTFNLAQALTS